MDQIIWCLKQKRGIELVEPSDNLRKAHLIKAEEALEVLAATTIQDWQLTTAYYTIYHAIYSILMKIGIRCEIHSCTIAFAKSYLNDYLTTQDFELVEKAFSARIDAQYYVNRAVPHENYELIMKKTPQFLVKCKHLILKQKQIGTIRERLKNTC